MKQVFLNDQFVDNSNAKVSVLDRGLLFGDSIYEVIPVNKGRMIGFDLHIERLNRSLTEVGMSTLFDVQKWKEICQYLIEENGDLPVYIQITRGAPAYRSLHVAENTNQTIIAFSLEPEAHLDSSTLSVDGYKVITAPDIRWQRCDIKSTSLIASVMSYQSMKDQANVNEVLMYDGENFLTEGCAVNVFVAKNGTISTPKLSNQLLPGITRQILIDLIKIDGSFPIQEREVPMQEVLNADEIFITSSTKNIGSVIEVDGKPVGSGKPGPLWHHCNSLFKKGMHHY